MKLDKQFKTSVIFSVLVVATLALIDIWAKKSGLFDKYYIGLPGQEAWWPLYRNISYIILLALPIFYYFVVKKDKSESIALYLNSWILWKFGLEDVLYYWFMGIPIDATLPWLNGMPFVHGISQLLGHETVTSSTLLVSVCAGFVVIYYIDQWLWRVN